MTKKRPTRREFQRLETQVDQMFDIVSSLATGQAQLADATRAIADSVGGEVGKQLIILAAMTERTQAVSAGVVTNH
ncbi:hypothetical protein [Rhizobium leguminosarum]|uniref:hypothetical protein n=1 Tax=Rhizobium leguminosarum TaxID=384 RepID=UPI001C90CD5D|nr:hypothetical protein [Rhizobium leguminosarum]MBY3043695.1 hypothetical protein [Rhizobium leguminosarum]